MSPDDAAGDALQATYDVERTKWDAHARLALEGVSEPTSFPTFAAFVQEWPSWHGVVEFLGPLEGKRVLEYGCGVGYLAAILATAGARVSAFDLSEGSVAVAQRRLEVNGLDGEVIAAAGETLPYADDSFDIAIGTSVLHHIEAARGAPELYRVLRPGGRASFLEPMGMNPLLNFARDHLYYRQKTERGADNPLTYDDLRAWGVGAAEFRYREGQLLSMAERFFGWDTRFHGLHRFDRRLLARAPQLRRFARQVAIFAVKGGDESSARA